MSFSAFVCLGGYQTKLHCGYCASENTASSFGFYSGLMTAEAYETMLNRGWRRSGRYMYKPDMRNTCCRLYAIRLEASRFKSRREHRKDINRFNRYIKGEEWDTEVSRHASSLESRGLLSPKDENARFLKKRKNEFDLCSTVHAPEQSTLDTTPHPPTLTPAHTLTIELDKDSLTLEKFTLYAKYQRTIHGESRKEITPEQFERFLCSSPFRHERYIDNETGEERPTGSFHQLYRVDGELVAFAVLDLLPNTVSSVYFVYDPDVVGRFGMGKVSALREVALCIEGGYKYYQLGLYAFGCEKLRYKAEMQPSELMDPETYLWYPYEKFKDLHDKGEQYITFNSPNDTNKRSPMTSSEDEDLIFTITGKADHCPYDPRADSHTSPLWLANMPSVLPRDVILASEGFWADFLYVREGTTLKKYWESDAVEDEEIREQVREMVAALGSLIFDMVIWIS